MRLIFKQTFDDQMFRNKYGLFLSDKQFTEKALNIAGFSNPLPSNLSLYYYALAGQGKVVVEVYRKNDEMEKG